MTTNASDSEFDNILFYLYLMLLNPVKYRSRPLRRQAAAAAAVVLFVRL
jgi:hypothetical protein